MIFFSLCAEAIEKRVTGVAQITSSLPIKKPKGSQPTLVENIHGMLYVYTMCVCMKSCKWNNWIISPITERPAGQTRIGKKVSLNISVI